MKLALCFSGQPRFVNECSPLIKSNVIGDYDIDRDKFIAKKHALSNFGASIPSGVHAPSATPTDNNEIALIFNMNAGKKTKGWNQIMTSLWKLK